MTPERYQKLLSTLNRRQPDLTLLTEQIHKPRNVAALVRTADAVGIHGIHVVWSWAQRRKFAGTAMGSQRWVDVRQHDSMAEGIEFLKKSGHKIYAAHFSSKAVDFRDINYTQKCAILMGNEKQGVSEETAAAVDGHITIPMMGMVESFNVSVAAAIILSEAQRQRAKAGMYDSVRLAYEQYWKTFFRWAHPEVAKYCDDRGLDYPEIREEDGEIVNPSEWYKDIRESRVQQKMSESRSGE